MSEDMYDVGFRNISNIDFSKVVVKAMQEKYADKESTFRYIEMDATDMEFADAEFDSVVDKGTLDSVLVSFISNSPGPSPRSCCRLGRGQGGSQGMRNPSRVQE